MERDRDGNLGCLTPQHGTLPAYDWERRFHVTNPPFRKRRPRRPPPCAGPVDDAKSPSNDPPERSSWSRYPRNSVYQWLQPDYCMEDESSESGLECLLEDSGSAATSSLGEDQMQRLGSATPPSELQDGSSSSDIEHGPPPKAESPSEPCLTEPKIADILTRSEIVRRLHDGRLFRDKFFEVRHSEHCGLGAFATQDLERGDVILREQPLLLSHAHHLYADFEKLDVRSKAVAFSMSRNDVSKSLSVPQVEAVWENNRFATRQRENDSGLFAIAGRFNHACRPANNVEFNYDKELHCLILTVDKDVPRNMELKISYGDRLPYQLWNQYGFKCECGACPGLSDHEIEVLDATNW